MIARMLAGAAALALTSGAASADFTLHVLHINDFHSRIEPINAFGSTCSAEDRAEDKCFGGVARLHTKINELRDRITAEGGNVIVLDAGDQFQGSLMYTTYKGAAEAEFMNMIGFDGMAVGNHEFDDGPEKLAEFIEAVDAPLVSGNLDLSQSNLLKDKVQNHLVLDVGGTRIGIVSALATDTVTTSSPGPNVIFQNEIDSIAADVARLEEEGVTKILALTHVGLPLDLDIASAVPGLDAVIGGHSHSYLSSSDPDRQGPYPTWVSRDDGAMVPVVQAGAYGKHLGHLQLTFDDDGHLIHAEGDALLLDAAVEENAEVLERVAALAGPIEELKARVVASAGDMIEGDRTVCRAVECPMGNLVAEAMLDRVRDQGIQIAIQNGGGLRASIDVGDVTMGEVLTVLPFQNTLSTFEVTGEAILAALENGVSRVEDGSGRFPQVAGLKYTFDPAKAPGERVSDVMVMDGGDFAPIDPARVYGVVSNDFVRKGGDGYGMFVNAMNAYDYGPDLADVTAEFLAANSPYAPFTDGRITVAE